MNSTIEKIQKQIDDTRYWDFKSLWRGTKIIVRGNVVDGKAKIGTAFIP